MLAQTILKEARERAESIGRQLDSDRVGAYEPIKALTSQARMKQLGDLSRYIIGNSTNKVYDETLNLDDTGLITYDDFLWSRSSIDQNAAEEAVKHGEGLGTADCLEIIVPYRVASDLGARAIHYSPWKKSQLSRLHDVQENPDGTALAILPTRLHDVNIHYSYSPGNEYPERSIVFVRVAASSH
jgi:hypothetical protein